MPVRYPAAASISASVTSSGCIIAPPQIRVDHAGAIVVPAGQQAGARRRADRRNVEVLEPDALPGELVEVRRLDLGVAVHAEVAVALVVGDDHHDVGASVGRRVRRAPVPNAQKTQQISAKIATRVQPRMKPSWPLLVNACREIPHSQNTLPMLH